MANSKKVLTKAAQARRIFKRLKNRTRKNVLPRFEKIGLSPAGASTYYNNIQNEFRLELIANQK